MEDYVTGESDPLLDPIIKSYYDSNLNLARTIGVKSSRSADEQNTALIDQYGDAVVDFATPTTWKYYMNLAGLYHPKDAEMTIVSLDTQETMVFNKTNLQNHPNTKTEYRFGTRYYLQLVALYPDQEDLIMGIIMPCDINTAIAAEDGTILRYDTNLVEDQEYSLMKDLEVAIKNHYFRVNVDAYRQTDAYYLMAYYANLCLFMIMKLFNLRDARRLTYEAHSFHVRMALKGYMNLDQYYSFLTREQAMYLYRNLPRLVKQIGFDTQFKELVDKILTIRNIQLFGYTVRQTGQINSDYKPLSVIKSEPLNAAQTDPRSETITPEELFQKEETVLYGTTDYYDANEGHVIAEIQNQDQAISITKDVITQSEDDVSIFTMTLQDFALNHWGYMSAVGLYTANVTFRNPRTGVNQTVSAKVAFSYRYYLSLSYTSQRLAADLVKGLQSSDLSGITSMNQLLVKRPVTAIPRFVAQHHVSPSIPTVSSIQKVVEQSYRTSLLSAAQALIDSFTQITTTNTTDLFFNLCVNIYKSYMNQNALASSFPDMRKRSYVKNMMYNMYRDTMVELYPSGNTVAQFLEDNNLDSFETVGDFIAELVTNIYEAGTGISTNTSSNQRYITEAMISIMRALSDYNIQFIDIINETSLTLIRVEPNQVNGYVYTGNGSPDDFVTNVARLPVGVYVQDVTSVNL